MAQKQLAPPFSGFTSFRDFPRSGAWAVARLNPTSGSIVLQMGAQPPSPNRELFAGAGFEGPIVINTAGTYFFSASVEVGPVTLLPRGHTVAAEIIIGIEGQDGASRQFFPPPGGFIGANFGIQTLAFSVNLAKGTYIFGAACGLLLDYSGTPNPLPYAEIIATYRSVVQVLPSGIQEGPEERSFRERGAETKRVKRELSDEQMATEGVIEFK